MSKIKDAEKELKFLEEINKEGLEVGEKSMLRLHKFTLDALQELIEKLSVHDKEKFK